MSAVQVKTIPRARPVIKELQQWSYSLAKASDLDPLVNLTGDCRVVALGEASHGTSEYYTWRAAISKRLIQEKGFNFIAVEGDWPDCYEVNRYIKGYQATTISAAEVLKIFNRWPTWMWANWEIASFIRWLHDYNKKVASISQIGFYGLDVYSLWDSLSIVTNYLKKIDHKALEAAYQAYQCFEPYGSESHDYALSTVLSTHNCEQEILTLLTELRKNEKLYQDDREGRFNAEQNALVAKNAEHYYRTSIHGGPESWNIRDRHMTETLTRLLDFYGPDSKAIVWEHNTHIGDARATDMKDDGMINVGQLVREQYGSPNVALVGFGSYEGSVIAGKSWDAPMEEMPVPRAQPHSWEDLMHQAFGEDQLLLLKPAREFQHLYIVRDHRAIGVVYNPRREFGNYVPTSLSERYDAFLYIDRTHALKPLKLFPVHDRDLPETYPFGE